MSSPRSASPFLPPALASAARSVFEAAGYTENGLLAHLDCGESLTVEPRELPRLRALTASGCALDTLTRLFMFGIAVDASDVRRALAPSAIEDWIAGGLLVPEGSELVAALRIVPLLGFRVAFDPPTHRATDEARPDHVPGLGRASSYLLNATVRRPVGRALDLGTGCGGQSLALTRHSRQVVATDVNPRALSVAAFNATLNGVANLELRRGSLFEPVAGEDFDLITMNPPFAISPDTRFTYRDAGMKGDGFVERVVRAAPAHLRPGGLLQITAQWAHLVGQDWRERIESWTRDSGCDVWVIRLFTQSAPTYAANWISETEKHDAAGFDARWRQWTEGFRSAGIEDVSTGLIQLRRGDGASGRCGFWVSDDVAELDAEAGEAIDRGFRARSFLLQADDARVLSTPFRVALDAVLEQRASSSGEGWHGEGAKLSIRRGLHHALDLDPRVAQLVGRCDGRRPLAELAAELAASLGTAPAGLTPSLVQIVRGLVERGLLQVPAPGAGLVGTGTEAI